MEAEWVNGRDERWLATLSYHERNDRVSRPPTTVHHRDNKCSNEKCDRNLLKGILHDMSEAIAQEKEAHNTE